MLSAMPRLIHTSRLVVTLPSASWATSWAPPSKDFTPRTKRR